MISLYRAARMPGEGLSPDVSSSGSVCTFSALGPGREGAGLGCAAGGGVVPDVPDPRLYVMFSLVLNAVLLGSLCVCNLDSGDCACIVARVGAAACAASGSPGGAWSATFGGAVATLASMALCS